MKNTNSALQVTNFDFYGDSLVALKDNATGEIYASINHILRNIGFTDRQVKHVRKKWNEEVTISKGVQNFVLPSKNGNQDTTCISVRKLPLALAKINITSKMKQNQPELASKLELYQDKCADVLASVFLDNKSTEQINTELMSNMITQVIAGSMTTILKPICEDIQSIKEQQKFIQKQLPKKRFSKWTSKMFPKYQLLMDYLDVNRKELYHNLYIELQNTYPDIDLAQEQDDFCFENNLDSCFTLDVIEHNKNLRTLFEFMVDGLLEKYNLVPKTDMAVRQKTIFDD